MAVRSSKLRILTALGLVVALLATRLPFLSHYLFEFDSIAFAVATFRYSLEQITPHMPGYILHVLVARGLNIFLQDINLAYVWESVLLSLGSLLFLWRAAALLRGERVALMAAILWLTLPVFWFYGLVATVYPHEAFWSSALLYFGIALYRWPHKRSYVVALFLVLSLATAARQTSLLFFSPAIIYLLVKTKQPLRVWFNGLLSFIIVTIAWIALLLKEVGGLDTYLLFVGKEFIYRSQSVLFGNSVSIHLAVIGKVLYYLLIDGLPLWFIVLGGALYAPKKMRVFIVAQLNNPLAVFVGLVAMLPLSFYLLIYFMKAGYLLNVLPSVLLAIAVLLDQWVIWIAERIKRASSDKLLLTRPLITKRVIIYVGVVASINILWFTLPLPGKESLYFYEAMSSTAYNGGVAGRFTHAPSKWQMFLNRTFAYTSLQPVVAADSISDVMTHLMKTLHATDSNTVILDTWWHRWAYYYNPGVYTYDIQGPEGSDTVAVGVARNFYRRNVYDSIITLPKAKQTLLFIREDHPDFAQIKTQVTLQKIEMPPYLSVYRIEDPSFRLKWKNRVFVKE